MCIFVKTSYKLPNSQDSQEFTFLCCVIHRVEKIIPDPRIHGFMMLPEFCRIIAQKLSRIISENYCIISKNIR